MDIVLVNAPIKILSNHARLSPPLGLGHIASVLIENGYSVSVVDFNISGYNPRILKRILEKETPRIIGISIHTGSYLNGLRIARLAKQLMPDITVVIGGTHPTILYKEVASEQGIDVVVIGEGEYTMLELADYFIRNKGTLNEIKGIAYSDKTGTIAVTPSRSFIENPDKLPFPARELFPLPLYEEPGQVLTSRGGCPYNCHFCAVNSIWKGKRRFRSSEEVIREIMYIHDNFGLKDISFVDDTFTLDRDSTIRLCDLSQNIKGTFSWRWKCATRVDLVDRVLLNKMHEAGCYSITYGIEAGSQKILDSIGKKITLDQIRTAMNNTLEVGIRVECAFMFPHPEDTVETILEQKKLMKELLDMGVVETLASTTPYPGTYYYENAKALGIKILANNWDEFDARHLVISTKHLSEERLKYLLEEMIDELELEPSI